MLFKFDEQSLTHPPKEVADFVDSLIQQLIQEGLYYNGQERRSEQRHNVALQVKVIPIDADLRPAGQGFVATTKDISQKGLAIIYHEQVNSPYLAIELTDLGGQKLQAALEVGRCRPVGPYFEIAGKYVTKVYDPLPGAMKPERQSSQFAHQA